MQRRETWAEDLSEVVLRHRAMPFAWGVADCATLFADCVAAVTGRDPFAPFRPWDSELSARRRLAAASVGSVAEFVAREFDEIVPADARRGDAGYASEAHALTCPAIILGAEAVSRDERGWIVMPRTAIVRAFKIGE